MFYLNTIEQLFLFVEQLFQLEVCLPYSRLLAGIPILAVFQNLRWNSNKTPLFKLQVGLTWERALVLYNYVRPALQSYLNMMMSRHSPSSLLTPTVLLRNRDGYGIFGITIEFVLPITFSGSVQHLQKVKWLNRA